MREYITQSSDAASQAAIRTAYTNNPNADGFLSSGPNVEIAAYSVITNDNLNVSLFTFDVSSSIAAHIQQGTTKLGTNKIANIMHSSCLCNQCI